MSTLLTTSALNPALRLILFEWPQRESLEFWLQNPLIVEAMPERVAATTEAMGGYSDKRCMQAVLALRKERDRLRSLARVGATYMSTNELVAILDHPLVSPYERGHCRARCFGLHPQEREWEADRLRGVLRLREEAAWQQHVA